VVRANNIFAKLKERDGVDADSVGGQLAGLPASALTEGEEADELWGLVLEASRLDEMSESAIRSLEISHVAKFAFGLAQAFNAFYHRQPILREEREDVRMWRAAAVAYCRQQLTLALDVMGIRVPHRM
jgi:arginyl-tRNA synthetase